MRLDTTKGHEMSGLTMPEDERQAFLAGMHVGVMGIADGDRGPLTVPVWYDYEPGGDVIVLTGVDSRKYRLATAAGRFSLCAQTEDLPYRYVMVEGPIVDDRPATHADSLSMAVRYLGEELGAAYAANSGDGSVRLALRPERWYSVDYGKLGG